MANKSKCKDFISSTIILCTVFISGIQLSEAEIKQDNLELAQGGYRKVSPLPDVSPKPDITQDREWTDKRVKSEVPQGQSKESEKESLQPIKVPSTLVGSEPTTIYYKISVNDKLYISVWRAPDLSLEFIVGPDGKISFPLIGDIDAANKTLSDLKAEITEKLKEYVENPQVSVMVREYAGNKLIVIGEVRTPGIYKFVGKATIMEILALAGGFTDRAKSASIVIVRQPDDPKKDEKLIVAHIKNILKGDLSKNIAVKPNDIIYVSRTIVSNVKEFYDNWIVPGVSKAIDVETFKSIKSSRIRAGK